MIEINDFYGKFKTKKEIDDELDNMPEEVWYEQWQRFIRPYVCMFGKLPPMSDFDCTRSEFSHALVKAISEKKEISEYLKKNTGEKKWDF